MDLHLTRREEVHSGDGFVTNGHETLVGSDVKSLETGEVLEDGSVRGTDGELHLGELGQDTKVSHIELGHEGGAVQDSLSLHIVQHI